MKNLIAINGSPRKIWNTAELLKHAMQGARDAGASTEIVLCAYDTVQFKDYSRYESSIFAPDEKFPYREKFFREDCTAAYEIGRALVA